MGHSDMHSDNRLTARLRLAPTRYEPVERLAVGGMAEVWRATATLPGSGLNSGESFPVAIKRVLPELASQDLYRSMFEDEARLGMLLRHRNIVRVYDGRDVAGTFIMVMELVDGTSLKELTARAQARRAATPVAVSLDIIRQVAAALSYAHSAVDAKGDALEIVHRDVSPHNILLGCNGDVKLADFGLADAAVHESATDLVGGKLGYLAPEVVRREKTDHRVDLFGLGIVLWEMLAGERLFKRESDRQTVQAVDECVVPSLVSRNPRVPEAAVELVDALLQANPEARPSTAGEVETWLERLVQGIDPEVGFRDVALLVGLHLAGIEKKKAPRPDVAHLLSQELDAFAHAAAGQSYDLGSAPLDPSEFGYLGDTLDS